MKYHEDHFGNNLAFPFLLNIGSMIFAAEYGTEAEARAKKAIAYIKSDGKEKALAEFSNLKGKSVDRDLYITVYDLNGKRLAHGANPKKIGKDLIGLHDPDGKAFVKERMGIAKTTDRFWQDYKFTDPITKKIEPKSIYCGKLDDILVACRIYKK